MKQNNPIGIYFGHKPDIRTHKEEETLPLPYKRIGIEIEMENIPYRFEDMTKSLFYWDITNDGSLRNYGAEFISRKVQGKDIAAALHEVNDFFTKYKLQPQYTDRTSVHIHIDCRYLLYDQLKSLIMLYLLYEPLLFEYVGRNREYSPYTVPYYMNVKGIQNLSQFFQEGMPEDTVITNVVGLSNRYEAMNLHSLHDHGSIEFRHHYGTHDKDKIYNWVVILFHLYKQAKETSDAELVEKYKNLPYEEIVREFNNLTKISDLAVCAMKAEYAFSTLLQFSVPSNKRRSS